ncbi:hypothetical protein ACFV9C_35130 [Kribbella sp. NPDC059898]|uniref:hypothetical protein n=1 Tax=Kribbella sp. NPDC059898 TaxID=3346995 RepID=UPI003668F20B
MTNSQPTDQRSGYPQQLWPDYAQARAQQHARSWPAGPVAAQRPRSAVLGMVGLIVGLAALVAPFLPPVEMTTLRQYGTVLLAIPGLALAVVGLDRRRRGRPVAAIGLAINLFALAILAPLALAFP